MLIEKIKIGNENFYNLEPNIARELGATEEEILQTVKNQAKKSVSRVTESYISQKLNEIDEDLSDLTSEADYISGVILTIAVKEGVKITTDEIKAKIGLFLEELYTQEQAITELKERGFSDEAISQILSLIVRAVEIGKIIAWKESIWKKEGELEKEIESKSLEELLELDVEKLCIEAYKEIPLEV